jgi:2-oxoglutarate ferredoxin oxidoreductase subunit alpha
MAGMMEVPIVCAMVSRPGPSTGMPTWTGQGDFRFVLHAGQEEFPRIILAPGDAKECFDLTFKAFNLADRYQVPVLILSDKLLGESYFTVPVDDFQNGDFKIDRGDIVSLFHCSIVDEKGNKQSNNETMKQCNNVYKRYEVTKSGISKRAIPGTEGYVFLANSYEHDEFGFSEEDVDNRVRQMLKRMRKMETMIKDEAIDSPRWYGPKKADLTLICWGSTKGVCLENVKCQMSNVKCNVLHFNHIYPLNIDSIKKELAKIKRSICVEGNYSGQFADYLYEKTGYRCDEKLVKFDGRPWFVEDIMDKIKK